MKSKVFPKEKLKRGLALTILMILAISLIASVFFIRNAEATSPNPWLTGWNYRKNITINPATGAGTDYQVKIDAYYGGDQLANSRFTNFVKTADNPLSIPDSGASGVVHPDVIYFANGMEGYKYWMAYTPDPPDSLEHPSIARSNDGIIWTSDGLTNPVVSVPTSYDADPAILYVSDLGKWFMVWTVYYASTGYGAIGFAYSTDGLSWTQYAGPAINSNTNPVIMSGQDSGGKAWEKTAGGISKLTEPTLIYEGGTIYLYYATFINGNNRGEVGFATFTWDNTNNQITNFQRNPTNPIVSLPADSQFASGQGHIDVSKSGSTYYMYTARASTSGGFRNCLLTSVDKLHWNYYGMVLDTEVSGTWEDTSIYRSCPVADGVGNVVDFSGTIKFYYTGYHGGIPHIGLATGSDVSASSSSLILNGHSQTDFGDVRFTASDGITLLNYYMQTMTPGNQAIFWVKVKDDLSTQGQSIYIYYGSNSPTSTTSDIKASSLWNQGDDFNEASLDTTVWNTYTSGTSATPSNVQDPNNPNNRFLQLSTSGSGGGAAGIISKTIINNVNTANFEISITGHASPYVELYLHNTPLTSQSVSPNKDGMDVPSSYRVMLQNGGVYAQKRWSSSGEWDTMFTSPSVSNPTTIALQVTGGNIAFIAGGHQYFSETWDSRISGNCYIAVDSWGRPGNSLADNLWIRKYVSPEPSASIFGTEQQLTPTIQSSDLAGNQKDTFNAGETLYASGTGFIASTPLKIYVVIHQDIWNIGDGLTDIRGGLTSATSDSNGNLQTTPLWNGALSGKYDIIVDVNNNGQFDLGDVKDSTDITPGGPGGFFVVPEYALGGLAALGACFVSFAIFKKRSIFSHFKRY